MERSPQCTRRFPKEMDLFKEPYYKINFIFLSLVGQWPYQSQRTRYLIILVIVIVSASFMEVQVMKLLTSEYSIDILIEILPFLFVHLVIVTKYCTCWFQNKLIKCILERIKDDWTALKSKTEHDILRKCAELGTMYGVFYMSAIFVTVFVYLVTPFLPYFLNLMIPLNHSRQQYSPFQVEYFFDTEKYFYVVTIHMDLFVIIAGTTLVSSDILFLTIVMHISGSVNVLGYRLEHLFDDVGKGTNNNVYINQIIRARIGECVKYHSNIYKYFDTVKSCYSLSSLIQLVLAIIIITTILLHIFQSLVRHDYEQVLVNVAHASAHAFAVFMNVLPAQKVIDNSGDIFYKTYFSRWYCAPVESQRLLLLLLQRSRVPMTLSILGIISSTMEMYVTILQTSMSYFTVLYSIN